MKSAEAAARKWEAELEALITERAGMSQENAWRISAGLSMAYPAEYFTDLANRIRELSGDAPVKHYWSEAERAGLKALGEEIRMTNRMENISYYGINVIETLTEAIRAYVEAARKVKEGKK